jgi:hypothetical protein
MRGWKALRVPLLCVLVSWCLVLLHRRGILWKERRTIDGLSDE